MKTISRTFWWVASFWFLALAGFLFFDLYGVRRPVQIFTTISLLTMGGGLLWHRARLARFDLFSLSYFAFLAFGLAVGVVLRGHGNELFNLAGALFFLIMLHLSPAESRVNAVKAIVLVTTFFAVSGIFQHILITLFPSLAPVAMVYNVNFEGRTEPLIAHWIQFFGLTNEEYSRMGGLVYRARSFMFEPSLVVIYFLAPAALAFRGNRRYRTYGWLCLVFAACTMSGNAMFSIAVGCLAYLFSYLKLGRLSLVCLLAIVFLIPISIIATGNEEMLGLLNLPGKLLGIAVLQKNFVGNIRISGNLEVAASIISNPLGTTKPLHFPIGSFLGAPYLYGLIGGVLNAIVFWLGMKTAYGQFRLKNTGMTISGILCVGSFFSAFFFAWYGFYSAYGMTLLYLIGCGATPDPFQFQDH